MSQSRGFTLIELLIVISIIALLSAIGLVAYSMVVKQGRDSKRQSDLRSIQSALEQYNNDQGFYPAPSPASSPFTIGRSLNACTGNPNTPCPAYKVYLNTIPGDPLPSPQPDYSYTPLNYSGGSCDNSSTNGCLKYCLYANLENSNPGLPGSCTNTSYNFAVTPP